MEKPFHKGPTIMKSLILPILLTASLTTQARAQQYEDTATLDTQIATATSGAARPIDPRLKLARCPQPVAIEPSITGAAAVRCIPLGWRIFVPVAQNYMAKDITIKRGDTIQLVIISEGFEVSTQVTAMQDGAVGDDVRVKTLTGATILTAKVTKRGTVSILD
jgi:flagellar basal body P-ring formation protein FlgA